MRAKRDLAYINHFYPIIASGLWPEASNHS